LVDAVQGTFREISGNIEGTTKPSLTFRTRMELTTHVESQMSPTTEGFGENLN
jgi:hypothetical protein